MTDDEFESVIAILGREPRPAELAMYSVMWSEHCSYKSSRTHLGRLPSSAPWVVVGPGENAGVVDLGDGWLAALRIESHNHPSFVEPYQGAATGVGGILRDIFTMGARPIAVWDPLRFGPLDEAHNRYLFGGVVSGIAGYGNAVGVPTLGGEGRRLRVSGTSPCCSAPQPDGTESEGPRSWHRPASTKSPARSGPQCRLVTRSKRNV
jgi:phosphoribosylformylglycinamidine synthase